MNEKNLLISLIKDDLLNYKLVSGLTKLGLDASSYCLNLSETIFYLSDVINRPDQDEIYNRYMDFCKQTEDIHPTDHEKLHSLANHIWTNCFSPPSKINT